MIVANAGRLIVVCWVVFIAVWLIAAWFTKRPVERSGTWARWIVWIAAILLLGTRSWWLPFASGSVWHTTASLAVVAAAVTASGLLVALWAPSRPWQELEWRDRAERAP